MAPMDFPSECQSNSFHSGVHELIPQYQSSHSSSFPGGAGTASFSGKLNDLALLLAESGAEVLDAPAGWTEVVSSITTGSTRLSLFYKFLTEATTSVTISTTADHKLVWVGCFTQVNTATPFGNSASQTNASGTTCTWPDVTHSDPESLFVFCCTTDKDTGISSQIGALTNANLANKASRCNWSTATGNGGVIYMGTATSATLGAIGTTTASILEAATSAALVFELMPLAYTRPSMNSGRDGFAVGYPIDPFRTLRTP